MSSDDPRDELVMPLEQCFRKAKHQLLTVWNEIGIYEQKRKERMEVVIQHVETLLNEMVAEEVALKEKLQESINSAKEDLKMLCQEMYLPSYEPESETMLLLERELRTKVDKLVEDKNERRRKMKRLKEQQQALVTALGAEAYYTPNTGVPTEKDLAEMAKHIEVLKAEKEKRIVSFRSIKEAIVKLFDQLEKTPECSIAQEVVCEDEHNFVLSKDNLQRIKILQEDLEMEVRSNEAVADDLRERLNGLWERLQIDETEREIFNQLHAGSRPKTIQALKSEIAKYERLKLQNIKVFIVKIREELTTWWQKCMIGEQQQSLFVPYGDDSFSEDLLELHETELQKWKSYYKQNEQLLTKIAKRQELWNKMLEFEKNASDPNRFNNRGGMLLQEEKKRNRILKELPQLEKELEQYITEWESIHGKAFLVNDQRFIDLVSDQWDAYRQEKENMKLQRQRAKQEQLENERLNGCKPQTPLKRRFCGTPAKTPNNKVRKQLNGSTTPRSQVRVHSSLARFHSPLNRLQRSTVKAQASSSASNRRKRSNTIPKRTILGEKNDNNNTVDEPLTNSTVLHDARTSMASTVTSYTDFSAALTQRNEGIFNSTSLLPPSPLLD